MGLGFELNLVVEKDSKKEVSIEVKPDEGIVFEAAELVRKPKTMANTKRPLSLPLESVQPISVDIAPPTEEGKAKRLGENTANKNQDEFYFKMVRTKIVDGFHRQL
ncbi:hypothetical protein Fmac_001477 [Flemingia macrophylla]|uniref:Uncharacterized protein n=1 Tax=Flemingia macrophylla TaxID=520843 RepID=A0ABD1NIG5_9FABA